jgi:hypothetical protein
MSTTQKKLIIAGVIVGMASTAIAAVSLPFIFKPQGRNDSHAQNNNSKNYKSQSMWGNITEMKNKKDQQE